MINYLKKLEKNEEIESIILFGSKLISNNNNDIDICIISKKFMDFKKKLEIIREIPEKYDISFYEDLPVHIRKEVLSKGKIIFTSNYYRILEFMKINDLEYIKYKQFLDDYNKHAMEKASI